jgi:YVTN family beta-propeller protein
MHRPTMKLLQGLPRLCVIAALLASGCGGSSPAKGGLFVTVKDVSMTPVADTVVSTEPATKSVTTDALGTVLLPSMPAGFYAVTAINPTQGSAREAVTVKPGELAEVTLVLKKDATAAPGAPTVVITAPPSASSFARGATITFRGMVADDHDAPGSLAIAWMSNVDGTFATTPAASDGTVQAAVATLSQGAHLITLRATDSGGLTGTKSIAITVGSAAVDGGGAGGAGGGGVDAGRGGSGGNGGTPDGGGDGPGSVVGSVVLGTPTKDTNGINLGWTITGSFTSYRVYRAQGSGAFQVINILNAPPTLAYRDETPQLGVSYQYRIGGVTAAGAEVLSNTQTITAGVYISVNSQVAEMLVDPTRPTLYALDSVNNSLHFVDLGTNAVSSTIFVGSNPVDMTFDSAATNIYVANFGSTEIAVVDLATQTKSGSLLVDTSVGTWDGNPFRLVYTAGNTLVFTSMDQWNNLKLINAATGANITAVGSVYEPALAASPDGTRVYVGESGISSSALARYNVSATGLTAVDTGPEVSYTSRQVTITRDGMYVFYAGQKYLANNLKSVLGTFAEVIVLTNGDGSVAVGGTRIFDGTTFSTKKMLPLTTTVMAISHDDKTLYLYDGSTSRIYLYTL